MSEQPKGQEGNTRITGKDKNVNLVIYSAKSDRKV